MKIIILGGGTAGWLAALTIAKTQPNHKVTVIESSKRGIIGAGEGSTGIFVDFIQNKFFDTGIRAGEFMEAANATYKLGIKHVNWKGDGTHYFAPLDGSQTSFMTPDIQLCQSLINNPEKPYLVTQLGQAYENDFIGAGHSYHFDAFKVGEFFAKKAIEAGVKRIDTDIVGSGANSSGTNVEFLVDEAGNKYFADFFIDCSGFGRKICASMIGMDWYSYSDHLPVNSAIAFQKPLDEEYEKVTTAIAMDAGWTWKIPTSERYGMGYVYSDKFITDQEALEEVNKKFDSPEILRQFKFTSGRSKSLWKGNCLALGLSAAFSEPLEATSIHTTIVQILNFVMEHLQETKEQTCNPYRIEHYNKEMIAMYDSIRDFLIVHYKGGRADTEFWKYMNSNKPNTEQVNYILDICKHSVPSSISIPNHNSSPAASLWNWVLHGTGNIGKQQAENTLNKFGL
jgi:flavin-dependent dehydrogenase